MSNTRMDSPKDSIPEQGPHRGAQVAQGAVLPAEGRLSGLCRRRPAGGGAKIVIICCHSDAGPPTPNHNNNTRSRLFLREARELNRRPQTPFPFQNKVGWFKSL